VCQKHFYSIIFIKNNKKITFNIKAVCRLEDDVSIDYQIKPFLAESDGAKYIVNGVINITYKIIIGK
jgi:hypothetical protein